MTDVRQNAAERATLLIVDADVLIRTAIAEYLRDCGYQVLEAASVAEAEALLDYDKISIQLLLADAGPSGSTDAGVVAEWARERRPGIDVLLAGMPERSVAKDAVPSGDPPLKRPYEPQVVRDRIMRLLPREPR